MVNVCLSLDVVVPVWLRLYFHVFFFYFREFLAFKNKFYEVEFFDFSIFSPSLVDSWARRVQRRVQVLLSLFWRARLVWLRLYLTCSLCLMNIWNFSFKKKFIHSFDNFGLYSRPSYSRTRKRRVQWRGRSEVFFFSFLAFGKFSCFYIRRVNLINARHFEDII